MIKSFLEPQVLFTVGLTAGASLVKQLSQDGGNHLFYSACFLKTGRDKSLNSKSSGPRIFSIPRKGMQYHAATRWEAWKKKSCMPDSVPPPYSPFILPELETLPQKLGQTAWEVGETGLLQRHNEILCVSEKQVDGENYCPVRGPSCPYPIPGSH